MQATSQGPANTGQTVGCTVPRRTTLLYVQNIPAEVTEDEMVEFFNQKMPLSGLTEASGNPVLVCNINPNKISALLEVRSRDETKPAMALDGINFKGKTLTIREAHYHHPGPSTKIPEQLEKVPPNKSQDVGKTFKIIITRTPENQKAGVPSKVLPNKSQDVVKTLEIPMPRNSENLKASFPSTSMPEQLEKVPTNKSVDVVRIIKVPRPRTSENPQANVSRTCIGEQLEVRQLGSGKVQGGTTTQATGQVPAKTGTVVVPVVGHILPNQARFLHVGNIPAGVTEEEFVKFFNQQMKFFHLADGPGNPVIACKLCNLEKNVAFLELRSIDETRQALALDGILFKHHDLKIFRPFHRLTRPGMAKMPKANVPRTSMPEKLEKMLPNNSHGVVKAIKIALPRTSQNQVAGVPQELEVRQHVSGKVQCGTATQATGQVPANTGSAVGSTSAGEGRLLHIQNIPAGVTEEEVKIFFNQVVLLSSVAQTAGNPVLACEMTPDKNFAFVEFRSVDEAKLGLALDGFNFKGQVLKIHQAHDHHSTSLDPENAMTSVSSTSIPEQLEKVLPSKFRHVVKNFRIVEDYSQEERFEAIVRVNVFSQEDVKAWVAEFQRKSCTTWRVRRTFQKNTPRIVYKICYCCHHNTRPKAGRGASAKHTNCQAQLGLTIGKPSLKQRNVPEFKEYPCKVVILHTHNHFIQSAQALARRDPAPEVREKFCELLVTHKPMSALREHKRDLQLEHGHNYLRVLSDRSLCPDLKWVYHLKSNLISKQNGNDQGERMKQKLRERIAAYNERCGCNCAAMESGDDFFAISVCSPLMRRVHQELPTAAELVTVLNMDRCQCQVFVLMAHSSVGGLPLGALITSSGCELLISKALQLLKSVLPERAFFGRGWEGPAVFITDDSRDERKSLSSFFPSSVLVPCILHILQTEWHFIFDAESEVTALDRVKVFAAVKRLVHSRTEEELDENFQEICTDPTVAKYMTLLNRFCELYDRREEWALCHRAEIQMHGHNMSNLDKAAHGVLQDKILLRSRAYNTVGLFVFLTDEVDMYYRRKILRLLPAKPGQCRKQGFIKLGEKATRLKVAQIPGTEMYTVQNKEARTYSVDVSIWSCSCPIGLKGGACKHQFAVCRYAKLNSMHFPISAAEKLSLHFVALGDKEASATCPNSLQGPLPGECDVEMPSPTPCSPSSSDDLSPSCSGLQEHVPLVDKLTAAWHKVSADVLSSLRKEPHLFSPAFTTFTDTYNAMKTTAEKVSALENFGCDSSGGRGIKRRSQQYVNLNMHPTSVSKRKRFDHRLANKRNQDYKNTNNKL